MWRLARWVLGIALTATVLLAFPYGPLFPWSPVHPGYEHLALRRADVFYPAGTAMRAPLAEVDRYLDEAEAYHRLRYHRRVAVVDTANWSDFHRFNPTLRGNAVGGVTLWTGTAVYLSPRIAERKLDPGEFVRHELSHAVFHQNASALATARMDRENWLFEGLPVAFARQKAYLTPEEFLERARKQDLLAMLEPGPGPRDMRMFYSTARYFLEYLMATRGRDRFQQLVNGFLARPVEVRQRFGEVYGMAWPDAVREYQERVRSGAWQVPR